jgi:hypothetical protein
MSANPWLNDDGTMKLDPKTPYTLTIRVHDPLEKADPSMSACWVQVKVPRAAIGISSADFIAKYISPVIKQISNLKLT